VWIVSPDVSAEACGRVGCGSGSAIGACGRCLWRVGVRPAGGSAGGGGELFELGERGSELWGLRPRVLQAQLRAAAVERESGGDVQQLVAQSFRFGSGEIAVEQERLGPDEQVVREHHDLDPYLVERELFERHVRQPGVLVVTDPVLHPGALTVATLDRREVLIVLIGEDRLEAVAVVVGEGELSGCGRSRRTINLEPSGQPDSSTCSVISTTSPFSRSLPSWSRAGTQASSGISRIAWRTGSVRS